MSERWRGIPEMHRFENGSDFSPSSAVIMCGRKGLTMSTASDNPTETDAKAAGAARPLARTWLWRRWYAKVWWLGATAYWLGKSVSFARPILDEFYTSALAGFLNILLFPSTILLILGFGFVRAWSAWSDLELLSPPHEEMFPKRSVGGWRDPYTDPLDPRSGTLWIGSPENQAKLFNRRWP